MAGVPVEENCPYYKSGNGKKGWARVPQSPFGDTHPNHSNGY
jgi:hypothetical protein